jgi:hypothetical protein
VAALPEASHGVEASISKDVKWVYMIWLRGLDYFQRGC